MNKSKLFVLISILTLILLFGISASCSMCGINFTTASDTQTDESITEASETENTDSGSTNSQDKAPTIKLSIYEGPTYSSADNVCYYRIEAIVTGSPAPTVSFSRDDSNGSLGSNKVQVNLTKDSPDYTLTAIAKNSAGEDIKPHELD